MLDFRCFGLVRHYQSQQEKEWPRLLVAMTSVSVSLMILALIPLDAFLVSYTVNSSTGLKKAWADETTLQWIQFKVELVYYLLASLVMFLAFFLIPYVFTAGIKSSAGLGIVGGVLFLSALFFKPHVLPHYESEWCRKSLLVCHHLSLITRSFATDCVYSTRT
ncbi:hypothetical protein BY458DRAFT_84308 [Sporodiniella umbellata]|nr:hypothetical protein BY458DRAFT_84308 [Sporodiniella umbellata]